MTLLLRV